MFASVSVPINLDDRFHKAAADVPVTTPRRTAPQTAGMNVSRPIVPWRWRTALVNAIEMIAVVWSIPFVIIAIGAPVALVIVALLWLARRTFGAF